jgi:hypothetical protein
MMTSPSVIPIPLAFLLYAQEPELNDLQANHGGIICPVSADVFSLCIKAVADYNAFYEDCLTTSEEEEVSASCSAFMLLPSVRIDTVEVR